MAADVRGHDDDRVLEIDRAALTVGQPSVVEDLQEHVEDVRVRLLDLVEEHDRERTPAHGFGELAALVVADVSGRRADQTRDGVLLLILRHVDANHRALVVEQVLASARASSVLPTPVGPRKMNEPIGRFGSRDPSARARSLRRPRRPPRPGR